MKRLAIGIAALVAVLALTEGDARAQHTRVVGKVTAHTTGKPVEGAKLVFKHVDTGVTYDATTDEKGSYRIARVKYGNYDVEVSKEGFTTVKQTWTVEARTNESTVINVDL